MGYYDPETDETPEERRMRLLAEMGSPFLGTRPDADMQPVDSGGVLGFMPQGFQQSGPAPQLGSPYLQDLVQRDFSGVRPGMTNDLVQRDFSGPPPGALQRLGEGGRDGQDWVDPGVTPGGSGRDYTDPPPRLGNFFRKPGEPSQPEQDGILFNGTRSVPGREVLAQETPTAAIPAGPIASPPDVNVTGANDQDRSNAPKPPDAPKTSAPISLPSMAGGLGAGPAAAYAASSGRVAGASAPASPAAPTVLTPQGAAGNQLPQPQAAAVADGLSRKPGSPAAMNWLQENADIFIAIGAGLLSGRNIGEGIIHGLKAANDAKATSAKIKAQEEANIAENLKRSAHANILLKAYPGMTPDQAIAMAEDSDLVKRAQQKVFPDPKGDPAWERTTLPDGTPVLINKETGDQKAAPAAAKEKPQETFRKATAADVPAGQDPTQFEVSELTGRTHPIGGIQEKKKTPEEVAVEQERSLKTKGGAERLNKLAEGRLDAQTGVALADAMQDLLTDVGPGLKAGTLATLGRYGIHLAPNADKVQAFQAGARRLAALQRTAPGDQSNFELKALEEQAPSIWGTPGGNQMLVDTLRAQAKHMDDVTRIAAEYQANPNLKQEDALRQIYALPNPFERSRRFAEERKPAQPAAPDPAAAAAPAGSDRIYDPRKKDFIR